MQGSLGWKIFWVFDSLDHECVCVFLDQADIRGSQCFADADADPFLFSNFAKIEKGRSKFR